MTRIRFLVIALSILFVVGLLANAQNGSMSLSGTIGGKVTILPTFGVASSLSLSVSYAGFKLGSMTNLNLFPTVGGNEVLSAEYSFEMLTLGSSFHFDLVPPGLDSIDAYASADLFSFKSDDGLMSFSGESKLGIGIVPSFSTNLAGTLLFAVGPLSFKSVTTIDPLPFKFSSQQLLVTLDFLDTTVGKSGPTLSGVVGTNLTLYPSFSGNTWLKLAASLNGITFTSKTTFALAPFGFSSQYMKAAFDIDPFSLYISATLTTGSPQAEAGISYSFP